MRAAGAFSACFERVPARVTTAVKIFGRFAIGAPPAARRPGRPVAVRAANFFKIGLLFVLLQRFENFFGFCGFTVKTEKPVQEREFLKVFRVSEKTSYHKILIYQLRPVNKIFGQDFEVIIMIPTLIVVLIIIAAFYLLLFYTGRNHRDAVRVDDSKVSMKWSYSPEEWEWFAGDPAIRWIRHKDIPGKVFIISEGRILVTNGPDEYNFVFAGERKLTQCTFFYSFLDLRTEWKTTAGGKEEYYHEDFRLYVPNAQAEKGLRLAADFQTMAEANAGFSRKFVKDNEIISLFGDDRF